MKTTAKFNYDSVPFNQDNEIHLVVGLEAPLLSNQEERSPICLVACVDVSGSMGGDKIHYAKQSALKMVEHLGAKDRFGVVTFNNSAVTVIKPMLMTAENKENAKTEIGKLFASGGTNFSGGFIQALKEIEDADLPNAVLTRIVMFTDGHANSGVQGKDALADLCEKNRGNITVSAFGYGTAASGWGGPDHDLLVAFSEAGAGNYAAIESPDDALSAFGKELGGLLSTYGQNIEIEIAGLNGHEITSVVSDVDAEEFGIPENAPETRAERLKARAEGDRQGVLIKIPDILSEEARHLVLAVRLAKQSKARVRPVNAFDVSVRYDCLDGGKIDAKTDNVKAQVKLVKKSDAAKTPDQELDKIVALAQVVRAQIDAEEQVQEGNFQGAQHIFTVAAQDAAARGHEGVACMYEAQADWYVDQASYTANMANSRGLSKGLTRSYGTSHMTDTASHLIGSSGLSPKSISNTVQDDLMEKFTNQVPAQKEPTPEPTPDSGTGSGINQTRSNRW
jgi:Ca-activated chloride channel family protein